MLLLKRKAPAPGLAPIAAGDGAPHERGIICLRSCLVRVMPLSLT
jgi:hypothetical protein